MTSVFYKLVKVRVYMLGGSAHVRQRRSLENACAIHPVPCQCYTTTEESFTAIDSINFTSCLLPCCFVGMQFVPGPTPGSIFILNATAPSWQLVDVLITLQPLVFEPLALPVRSYVDDEDGFNTPVVLLINNCADLKVCTCLGFGCWIAEFRSYHTSWHGCRSDAKNESLATSLSVTARAPALQKVVARYCKSQKGHSQTCWAGPATWGKSSLNRGIAAQTLSNRTTAQAAFAALLAVL